MTRWAKEVITYKMMEVYAAASGVRPRDGRGEAAWTLVAATSATQEMPGEFTRGRRSSRKFHGGVGGGGPEGLTRRHGES